MGWHIKLQDKIFKEKLTNKKEAGTFASNRVETISAKQKNKKQQSKPTSIENHIRKNILKIQLEIRKNILTILVKIFKIKKLENLSPPN